MKKELGPIAEKGFPKELKKLTNDICDVVNRDYRVRLNHTNGTVSKFEEDEDSVTLILGNDIAATIPDIIITFNAASKYCDLRGNIKGDV